MKVLLINPPYQTITSNLGVGHQVPLGLLMIGGPLLDAGHEVSLLDAECRRMRHAVVLTDARPPIPALDDWRVGWELIERWDDYRCFGLGRAAIVQFSRGCPHRCTYCGQHGFWVRWRHRSPARLADEIAWLHRTCGVRFHTLADENPTTLRDVWQRFLEELAAPKLPVHFFPTIRATDIVRDAD